MYAHKIKLPTPHTPCLLFEERHLAPLLRALRAQQDNGHDSSEEVWLADTLMDMAEADMNSADSEQLIGQRLEDVMVSLNSEPDSAYQAEAMDVIRAVLRRVLSDTPPEASRLHELLRDDRGLSS